MLSGSTLIEKDYIYLKNKGVQRKIPLTDILFVESNNNKITIHTMSDTVESYQKLNDLYESLCQSFSRCHRCYIVNMNYVIAYNKSTIWLSTKEIIPLSRRKYKQFAKEFMDFTKNDDIH